MEEHLVLTQTEALELLAHLFATADLHVYEGPYYADRRILEGTLTVIDAIIRDGDSLTTAGLKTLRTDIEHALTVRERDRAAYRTFLLQATGRIIKEIKRHQADSSAKQMPGEQFPSVEEDEQHG